MVYQADVHIEGERKFKTYYGKTKRTFKRDTGSINKLSRMKVQQRQQLYQDTFTNLKEKGKALLSSGQSKQEENHTKEEARDAASV